MSEKKSKLIRQHFLRDLEDGMAEKLPNTYVKMGNGQVANPRRLAYRMLKRDYAGQS